MATLKAQVEELAAQLAELRKTMADKESAWEDLRARGVHRIKQLESDLMAARANQQPDTSDQVYLGALMNLL